MSYTLMEVFIPFNIYKIMTSMDPIYPDDDDWKYSHTECHYNSSPSTTAVKFYEAEAQWNWLFENLC